MQSLDDLETYWKLIDGKIVEKVFENMKRLLNSVNWETGQSKKELFMNYYKFSYHYSSTKNKKRFDKMIKEKFSVEIDYFDTKYTGVVVTSANFDLFQIFAHFYNKYNLNKNYKIEKYLFFDHRKYHDYSFSDLDKYRSQSPVPVEIMNPNTMRQDGLLRSTSCNNLDESHYKDLSNAHYEDCYLVVDADLVFVDYFDLEKYQEVDHCLSHMLKINNKNKYWIGANLPVLRPQNNWQLMSEFQTKYINMQKGINYNNVINKMINGKTVGTWEKRTEEIVLKYREIIKHENIDLFEPEKWI